MPLRGAYAPMRPEFDRFLFATVGEEVDGVPLSVLSALSRLGLDPRDEAARLAHLTKEAAAAQLANMIARLSDRSWSLSQVSEIAGRLIERLPMSTKNDELARSVRNWHCAYTCLQGFSVFSLRGVVGSLNRRRPRQWPPIIAGSISTNGALCNLGTRIS